MAEVPIKGLQLWATEWLDAHSSSLEYERSEIIHRPIKYVTVGILLKDDDTGITYASDVCETNTFRSTNFIPRSMIVDTWKVGPLTRRRKKVQVPPSPP
mgnify:CR=1 FL=1